MPHLSHPALKQINIKQFSKQKERIKSLYCTVFSVHFDKTFSGRTVLSKPLYPCTLTPSLVANNRCILWSFCIPLFCIWSPGFTVSCTLTPWSPTISVSCIWFLWIPCSVSDPQDPLYPVNWPLWSSTIPVSCIWSPITDVSCLMVSPY